MHTGATADTSCAAGFHMASLWEIFDVSGVEYDTTRGVTEPDSGQGPPIAFASLDDTGWVRTGHLPGTTTPGIANCNAWTTAARTLEGSLIHLNEVWNVNPSTPNSWKAETALCSVANHVWCVQD